jgi:hypothetical protein
MTAGSVLVLFWSCFDYCCTGSVIALSVRVVTVPTILQAVVCAFRLLTVTTGVFMLYNCCAGSLIASAYACCHRDNNPSGCGLCLQIVVYPSGSVQSFRLWSVPTGYSLYFRLWSILHGQEVYPPGCGLCLRVCPTVLVSWSLGSVNAPPLCFTSGCGPPTC